ncbi:unnamed protein product [marine sediment metagenome]|uniref:Uncharacterized protein n=1 Tax=marine sediment metagenome TaxID=412755 RepID=X1LFE4_9ZZZZ
MIVEKGGKEFSLKKKSFITDMATASDIAGIPQQREKSYVPMVPK